MSLYGLNPSILNAPNRATNPDQVQNNNPDVNTIRQDYFPGPRVIQLLPWQAEIVNRITNRLDTFVSVPPSAGKTLPVLTAWYNMLINRIQNPNNFLPKILYVVPRKQLASQIAQNDFIADQNYGLAKILYDLQLTHRAVAHPLRMSHIKELVDSLVVELVGGGPSNYLLNHLTSESKNFLNAININTETAIVIVATYEIASSLVSSLRNHNFTHVIVDEIQELIPNPNETVLKQDTLKKYTCLVNVLKFPASRTLMTGSVNNETVKKLVNLFNTKLRTNFEIVPQYNPQQPILNRSQISIQVLSNLEGSMERNYQKRLALCRDIVLNRKANSVMIIFSKKQTGTGIFRLLKDLIRLLPVTNKEFLYDDTPARRTKLQLLRDIMNGKIVKSPNIEEDDVDFLQWFDINSIYSENNQIQMENPDPDNILYQSVLRGVAPFIGALHQRHKRIIQKLFVRKKIYLLLATDALGIGANIYCRDLYIPTIEKQDDSRLSPLDESTLVQLINRAGRGKFSIANIYCSVQDYDYIKRLALNDPRGEVSEIDPRVMEQLEKVTG